MASPNDPAYQQYRITEGLRRILRDELEVHFKEEAQPIIDRAVEQAMASMEIGIESLYEPHNQREVIHAIIKDKRSKA